MEPKKQLYYLLEHYFAGEYTTQIFADEFSRIYNLELDYRVLSDFERKLMKELMEVTVHFSPFEEDFHRHPGLLSNERDVKKKATEVYFALLNGMS